MTSNRRNMFYENKKQETAEITSNFGGMQDIRSQKGGNLPLPVVSYSLPNMFRCVTLYSDHPQSLRLKVASNRRNTFYKNKRQETTEIEDHVRTPPSDVEHDRVVTSTWIISKLADIKLTSILTRPMSFSLGPEVVPWVTQSYGVSRPVGIMRELAALKDHLRFKTVGISFDNIIFRLHYRWTCALLLASTVLICSIEYLDQHIQCIADDDMSDLVNSYCYFMSTFTLGGGSGIDHYAEGSGKEVRKHRYYQWVPFFLFVQAIFFYVPHYVWKMNEGRRLKSMVEYCKKYMCRTRYEVHKGISYHKFFKAAQQCRDWGVCLIFCEVLNAANLVFQIYLTDKFMAGNFLALGPNWLASNDKQSFLDQIFPKVTKCTFFKFGSSGTLQHHDALCVMSLNVVYEKIFCILWFWMAALVAATFLGILWRVVCLILHTNYKFNRLIVYINHGPLDPKWRSIERYLFKRNLTFVSRQLHFLDWLLMFSQPVQATYAERPTPSGCKLNLVVYLSSETRAPDGYRRLFGTWW
ncbi:hypothetical protein AAG570_003990 [Ranatra chinensis]|uniref:Innexin n=1 Tax=Ranatra chinensis TaxID=642074 RepID=A0ABD0Y3T7_9HEMI